MTETTEAKTTRRARWNRRKRISIRYCQRGWIGGNPRYSGKSGGTADKRAHKSRKECHRSGYE